MYIQFNDFPMVDGGVCAPKGFKAGGVHCGIRKNKTKKDLSMLVSDVVCNTAAIYTTNKVKGAPLLVTKENISDGKAQAMICNSGIANTCNPDGIEKAQAMCQLAADALGISPKDIIVASTGVIGQPLPLEPIEAGIKLLLPELRQDGNIDAAEAIMTTDTHHKEIAVSFELGGQLCKIGGMAKGSGMIHPNMATMLCFITTDVAIRPEMLQKAIKRVADITFNMISVDGDTSTNDMVNVLASGLAGNREISDFGPEYETFVNALYAVMMNLSRVLAGDGEGATRLLECTVTGAPDDKTARIIAKSVITSPLVKSAMFGTDANWGRVLCAIGYAETDFSADDISVSFLSQAGSVEVCRHSGGVAFDEELAKEILSQDEVKILVHLADGNGTAIAWGCDLTYDYVRINGDYRT